MRRSCKGVDLRDPATVEPWVLECLRRHRRRHDFRRLLREVGGLDGPGSEDPSAEELRRAARAVAGEACRRIAARDLSLPPVTYRERRDPSSGKLRLIGNESAMQQVLDYIAVRSCEEVWERRLVPQQVAGVPGRGAVYCARMVQGWVDADARAASWARRHGRAWTRRCRWHVKLDVRQCYPSLRVDRFMRLFRRDCANEDALWLWEELLSSHAVDGYEGFMIGALTSQWACQYLLSFLYRHATSLAYERRGRRVRKVAHMALQMDDLLLVGPSRKGLVSAARELTRWARDELGLEIKGGWHVRRLDRTPIDLAGFRVHADGAVDVRPRVFLRARRAFLRSLRRGGRTSLAQARRICAYKGWFIDSGRHRVRSGSKHADSRRAWRRYRLARVFSAAQRTVSINERRAHADGMVPVGA